MYQRHQVTETSSLSNSINVITILRHTVKQLKSKTKRKTLKQPVRICVTCKGTNNKTDKDFTKKWMPDHNKIDTKTKGVEIFG